MASIEDAIAGFIKLRDAKRKIQERHKEELKPYNDKLYRLETWMQKHLQQQGAQNIKTAAGTVFRVTKSTPKVVDSTLLVDFLKENDLIHMLKVTPDPDAVSEYVESTGDTPPGITIVRESFARVRK